MIHLAIWIACTLFVLLCAGVVGRFVAEICGSDEPAIGGFIGVLLVIALIIINAAWPFITDDVAPIVIGTIASRVHR